jgi:hypothetical protein
MVSENEQLDPTADLPAADGGGDDAADVRVQRILQHVADSLQEPDALQAAVGAAAGDLLLLQYRLRHMLEETLQETPDSLTAIAEVQPALTTYMKLSQQVGQYVQLALKIKAAKGSQMLKSSSGAD